MKSVKEIQFKIAQAKTAFINRKNMSYFKNMSMHAKKKKSTRIER